LPTGGSHSDRQRYIGGFSKHAAFDATFGAVAWAGACFFPHPAAPWSSPHPAPANSSRCRATRRTPASPDARRSRTCLYRSIPGIAGRPMRRSRFLCHPEADVADINKLHRSVNSPRRTN
jgi:hypothetical protein